MLKPSVVFIYQTFESVFDFFAKETSKKYITLVTLHM